MVLEKIRSVFNPRLNFHMLKLKRIRPKRLQSIKWRRKLKKCEIKALSKMQSKRNLLRQERPRERPKKEARKRRIKKSLMNSMIQLNLEVNLSRVRLKMISRKL
jgi:hypothetical protein